MRLSWPVAARYQMMHRALARYRTQEKKDGSQFSFHLERARQHLTELLTPKLGYQLANPQNVNQPQPMMYSQKERFTWPRCIIP